MNPVGGGEAEAAGGEGGVGAESEGASRSKASGGDRSTAASSTANVSGAVKRPTSGRRRNERYADPQGRQALFTTPVTAAPDQLSAGPTREGRRALFSTGPPQPGTAVVRCSRCRVRTRVSLLDLGVRAVSISAWIPGRRYGHWLRCPSCHTHSWCSIGFRD